MVSTWQLKEVNLVKPNMQQSKHIELFAQNRIVQHIFFWIVILIYFTLGYGKEGNYRLEFYRSFVFLFDHMFLVYSFFYVLIPRFLLTKKFLLFALFAVVVYTISIIFSWFLNFRVLAAQKTWWSIGASLLGGSTVLGIAISIKFLKSWYKQKQQILEAENQRTIAELELLKSQVHPHFLFNTLNNLYSHTLKGSEKSPEIVLKLSNLLRFMIYESKEAYIPLQMDLAILQQYMDLEQLRYGDRLDISMRITGNIEDEKIAPLLLLPLVENAFKFGVSNQLDQCWISFDVNVEQGIMKLKLINSKDEESGKKESGGLGLQNVKKRLAFLYPGRHQLHISNEAELFVIDLSIQLSAFGSEVLLFKPLNTNTNEANMFAGR